MKKYMITLTVNGRFTPDETKYLVNTAQQMLVDGCDSFDVVREMRGVLRHTHQRQRLAGGCGPVFAGRFDSETGERAIKFILVAD